MKAQREQRKEGQRLYELATSTTMNASDFKEAIPRLFSAAELKNPDALYTLATYYRDGEGVEQDDKETIRYLKLAAEQGHCEALFRLAFVLKNGEGGVQKDSNEARYWRRLAKEKNLLQALSRIISSIYFQASNSPIWIMMSPLTLLKDCKADHLARFLEEEAKVLDSIIVMTKAPEQEKAALTKELDQYIEQNSLLPDVLEEKRVTWEKEANTLYDALNAVKMTTVLIPIITGYGAFFRTVADVIEKNVSEDGPVNIQPRIKGQ